MAASAQHYPAETAAAIVQRAIWPEQLVLRGTLATIAAQAARGRRRPHGDDPRRRRPAQRGRGVAALRRRVHARLPEGGGRRATPARAPAGRRRSRQGPDDPLRHARSHRPHRRLRGGRAARARPAASASPSPSGSRSGRRGRTSPRRASTSGRCGRSSAACGADHAAIVGIMASGIMVRAIAPHVASKYEDPAVIVVDDAGRYVISLLVGARGRRQPAGRADRRRDARARRS